MSTKKSTPIKTFKGFDSDLKCRDFQYEVGKTYECKGDIIVCNNGFHAIAEGQSPLSVFNYYPPSIDGKQSRYCEVTADGDIKTDGNKVACSKLTVGAEIGIKGLVNAHIEWVKNNLKKDDNPTASNSGDYSSASNTGNRSSASNTGYYSSASNTGYQSSASNTGYYSSASNTGNRSSASNTGNQSSASNTGNRSSASNTGYYSSASNTGNQSSASNTGNYSSAEVSGENSVAIVTGKDCKVRGSIGCAIVCVERGEWNGKTYPLIAIKSAIVDGKEIKADTWYTVKNNEWVEIPESSTTMSGIAPCL